MFYNCTSLKSLDLSSFSTPKLTDMSYMFENCTSLKTLDMSNFITKKIVYMNKLFYNCTSLEYLDISNFKTPKVTSFNKMFYGCSSLKVLDISGFTTEVATSFSSMFYNCSSLKSIYASANFIVNDSGSDMFYNCTSLVGGSGTIYNSSKVDKTYAHVDEGTSNPGYFTSPKTRVKFNANGGELVEFLKYYNSESEIGTLPVPVRDGYEFDGWYTDILGGTMIDEHTIVSSNVTYYAHWRSL